VASARARLRLRSCSALPQEGDYLELDGLSTSHYLKRSADGSYREIPLANFQVNLGPETRESFDQSRLALAFGERSLLGFPFRQRISAEEGQTLDFMAPEEDSFLIILPPASDGDAFAIAIKPGWNALP